MALPCWVTAPTPAATDGERQRNSSSWLLAIAAAAHPACPAWNRAWRLACDVGPPLAAYGPQCDNGALSPQDASVCDAFYAPLLLPQPPPPAPAPLVYVPTLCLPAFAQHVLPRVPALGAGASAEECAARNTTTLGHFWAKLLRLQTMMKTATGAALARERHAFMETFLAQFQAEVVGER
jgi:hypothetical protein